MSGKYRKKKNQVASSSVCLTGLQFSSAKGINFCGFRVA